jgi:hypothetical protein
MICYRKGDGLHFCSAHPTAVFKQHAQCAVLQLQATPSCIVLVRAPGQL